MNTFSEAALESARLLLGLDSHLLAIVALSLEVSITAALCASVIGLPIGAMIAVRRFPGRQFIVVVLNALMGLPPVVAGLVVYLLLSRAGPLGHYGILFTPAAMIIAQTVLVLPIIAALTRQSIEDAWRDYEEQLKSLGVTPSRAALTLLWDCRFSLLTAVLAGFGRAVAEVGAVMTTIALETSKGDLPLALGLGAILLLLVLTLNALVLAIRDFAERRYG